ATLAMTTVVKRDFLPPARGIFSRTRESTLLFRSAEGAPRADVQCSERYRIVSGRLGVRGADRRVRSPGPARRTRIRAPGAAAHVRRSGPGLRYRGRTRAAPGCACRPARAPAAARWAAAGRPRDR